MHPYFHTDLLAKNKHICRGEYIFMVFRESKSGNVPFLYDYVTL